MKLLAENWMCVKREGRGEGGEAEGGGEGGSKEGTQRLIIWIQSMELEFLKEGNRGAGIKRFEDDHVSLPAENAEHQGGGKREGERIPRREKEGNRGPGWDGTFQR